MHFRRSANSAFRWRADWFKPHLEFRFPVIGSVAAHGAQLELSHALEPWHVLGEDPAAGGTVRYVDSSAERLQAKVQGWVEERFILACKRRRRAAPADRYARRIRRRHPLQGLESAERPAPHDPRPVAAGLRHLRPLERPVPGRAHPSRLASRRPQLRQLPGQCERGRGPSALPLLDQSGIRPGICRSRADRRGRSIRAASICAASRDRTMMRARS